MKKQFSLMLLLATVLMFTACGGDDEPDNIKLSKTTYSMYHEDTQTIEGTNLADIVWESDNEFVLFSSCVTQIAGYPVVDKMI